MTAATRYVRARVRGAAVRFGSLLFLVLPFITGWLVGALVRLYWLAYAGSFWLLAAFLDGYAAGRGKHP